MQRISARHPWLTIVVVLGLIGTALSPLAAQPAPKLKVVTSTSDLAALAAEVGGNRIEVESLARGDQDPHFVQPKPSYLLKLRRADFLIVVGLELESGWLTRPHHPPSLLSQSGNPRIQPGAPGYLDASQYVEVLETPARVVTPGIQPFGNPHYWLDPENGRRIARALANEMSEMRPADTHYFNERFQAFSERLARAEKAWDAQMQPYHGRKVVTYARSWSYFLKRFQLVSLGEIEPQPGVPPSRAHTRELIQRMKAENVEAILLEPYFELNTPDLIARGTGAKVVVIPSSVGGEKGVADYFQLFDCEVRRVSEAFRAKP